MTLTEGALIALGLAHLAITHLTVALQAHAEYRKATRP